MNKIFGTKLRPRISVFRSNRNILVQAIDDEAGKTIVSHLSNEIGIKQTEKAKKAGEKLAIELKAIKIDTAVFDRGKYRYHGAIKNIAESLRENGIKI